LTIPKGILYFIFKCCLAFVKKKKHSFALLFAIEGSTDNVLQFIVLYKSIHNQNLSFVHE